MLSVKVMTNGFLTPSNYVDPDAAPIPLWGKRADRIYLNAVESFAPFAALRDHCPRRQARPDAMTAVLGGVLLRGCGWCTPRFYLFALPYVRTLSSTLGFVCGRRPHSGK